MKVETTKNKDVFVEHPDGGHCNVAGMTTECYGCVCYGCGLVDMCNDNVKKLREWICKVYKIPREFLFNDNGNLKDIRVDDEKFNQFIEKLKSHSNG